MGVIYAFCTPQDIGAIEAAYEAAMISEVEEICRNIPHDDLCIQWDFCHEMVLWDGQPQDMFPTINASERQMIDRIARICAPVPEQVELGFHLCYGDFGARHFIEPADTTKMVEVMNEIAKAVAHPIAYFHLPVPVSRNDDAYFRPLQGLRLPRGTEIYLGLVHSSDGPEGTRKRIDAARKYINDFGVATECGMARARTAGIIQNLLDVHVAVTQEPATSN
jgi:methionine synthase II (cobalamin-independent)